MSHDEFPYGDEDSFRPQMSKLSETSGAYPDEVGGGMPDEELHGELSEGDSERVAETIMNGIESLEQNIIPLIDRGTKAYESVSAKVKKGTPNAEEYARRMELFDDFQKATDALKSVYDALPAIRGNMSAMLASTDAENFSDMQELDERYRNVFRAYGMQLVDYAEMLDGIERFETTLQ